jgi:hypothetical protein
MKRVAAHRRHRPPWARLVLALAALLGGCGYGSVYPQPQLRGGGPLVEDTGPGQQDDPAAQLPCSPPPGDGAQVDVLIVNRAPIDIFIKDAACVEVLYLALPAAYSERYDALPEGTSLVIRDLEGAFLAGAVVTADAEGAWRATLP